MSPAQRCFCCKHNSVLVLRVYCILHAQIDENSSLFGWDAMSLDLIYRSNNTGVCGGTPSSSVGVVKFQLPTIAAGKLYLGCGDRVLTYSLV